MRYLLQYRSEATDGSWVVLDSVKTKLEAYKLWEYYTRNKNRHIDTVGFKGFFRSEYYRIYDQVFKCVPNYLTSQYNSLTKKEKDKK